MDEGAYYDPWERRKIDANAAVNRASATCVVPEGMSFGLVHEDEDVERTPRDESRDFNGYVRVTETLPRMVQPNRTYGGGSSSNEPYVGYDMPATPGVTNDDGLTTVRRFLEESGVLSSSDPTMSLSELLAYVRGHLSR